MTTYVVGDIQGCFDAFQSLLEDVAFDPASDRLWAVGDLVNRGADNLSTLRWFYQHRDSVTVVLGNHDLSLLAIHVGAVKKGRSDNIEDVLEASDADELLHWLQQCPLAHFEHGHLLVHAGLPPQWSIADALGRAREVETVLRGPNADRYFHAMYGNEPSRLSPQLRGLSRLRAITNYLTRMRFCTASGRLDLVSKKDQPEHALLDGEPVAPWFSHPHALKAGQRVVFGHWASLLGKTGNPEFIGLDTGCVWGGQLTFYALETQERHYCDCSGGLDPTRKRR